MYCIYVNCINHNIISIKSAWATTISSVWSGSNTEQGQVLQGWPSSHDRAWWIHWEQPFYSKYLQLPHYSQYFLFIDGLFCAWSRLVPHLKSALPWGKRTLRSTVSPCRRSFNICWDTHGQQVCGISLYQTCKCCNLQLTCRKNCFFLLNKWFHFIFRDSAATLKNTDMNFSVLAEGII